MLTAALAQYAAIEIPLGSEAGARLIKQPGCSLQKISEAQLVQPAVSAMPLRSCAADN